MSESLFDNERKLRIEMLDAAQHVADVAHVEKDPLLIILWRLNHQDRTLEAIKGEVKGSLPLLATISPEKTKSRNLSTVWLPSGKGARLWRVSLWDWPG